MSDVDKRQEAAQLEAVRQWRYQVLPAFTFMVSVVTSPLTPPPVPPEIRCMGYRCPREAEFAVHGIDPNLAVTEFPARLCRRCLGLMDERGSVVDLFRWLTNNRIEASSRG